MGKHVDPVLQELADFVFPSPYAGGPAKATPAVARRVRTVVNCILIAVCILRDEKGDER